MKSSILSVLVVLAFAGCAPPYSYTGVHTATINGNYDRDRTATSFTNHDLTHFDGREAYWQCVRVRNQQVYNAINQAAYARERGLPVPYAAISPQDIDAFCRSQTSGPVNGGMMMNGVTVMPGVVGFQGGSFDAMRVPMTMMATVPSVQIVPAQSGASAPNVAGDASTNALNQRIGIIYREVDRQGRAIERLQSHR